ncbi:uracil-DNA glycosylase family protein [uncultured Desulfosarcina sp.]|uniref:uracil-DNA glycosylase family protein n=1 Tax=uncultured Desulfosarcina sp. TaxID=218289 RepID=UPI0029C9786D|nr:uracil-DNA glycosylase family protein [uncultured Desulfosarcina sp.]
MALTGGGPADGIGVLTDELVRRLKPLTFSDPVTHVYNPIDYARNGYDRYVARFGNSAKEVLLLGMNPGPFGMVQTGVPFGDVEMVTGWMGITTFVSQPEYPHPKRPVDGFSCSRREVSGGRLWGWAKQRFGPAEAFFSHFFVLNYCPLVFMEASGRNRTPDRLPAAEKKTLFSICDRVLRQSVAIYRPRWVVGIGAFAEKRAVAALEDTDVKIGRISHPSPANPKANRGWDAVVERELADLGIDLPAVKR